MPTVELNIPGKDHRYEIVIEPGAIDTLGEKLAQIAPHAKAAATSMKTSKRRMAGWPLRALKEAITT